MQKVFLQHLNNSYVASYSPIGKQNIVVTGDAAAKRFLRREIRSSLEFLRPIVRPGGTRPENLDAVPKFAATDTVAMRNYTSRKSEMDGGHSY